MSSAQVPRDRFLHDLLFAARKAMDTLTEGCPFHLSLVIESHMEGKTVHVNATVSFFQRDEIHFLEAPISTSLRRIVK